MPVDKNKDKDKDRQPGSEVADDTAADDGMGGDPSGAAADDAAAEIAGESGDGGEKDPDIAHGELDGVKFEFSKKRLDSVQFRRFMQHNRDIVALEFLLGMVKFDEVLTAMADKDGNTTEAKFNELWDEIGRAGRSGN